jgi:hypothetical protein
MREKYLEAYSLVEALELQLERLRQEGLRTFGKRPVGALLTPKPPPAGAQLSLAFSGRQYEYGGQRYDCVADPVSGSGPD